VHEALPAADDAAVLGWLAARSRVAVFGFSEDPYHVGYLGEAVAQALRAGSVSCDLHLWSRATPYDGLVALHPNRLVRLAESTLGVIGFAGGYRALTAELCRLAGDRVRVDTRTQLPAPDDASVSASLTEVRRGPVRDARYRGYPVGWAVLSSLAQLLRSSYGDDIVDPAVLDAMTVSYATVFDAALHQLRESTPDAAMIFNGRFLHESAVRDAATQLGVPTVVAEVGHKLDSFSLHWGSAHNRAQYTRRMRQAWGAAVERDADGARVTASSWFSSRRAGSESRNPYVSRQSLGELPELAPDRRRIVYFTSSNDEFLSAGPEWVSPFGTQGQILEQLVDRVQEDTSVQLIIRMHPHTLLKHTRDQQWWRDFTARVSGRQVCVVAPESRVDSYALVESADVVLTIGSTIGIEAAYLQVPSATLGPTLYDSLDVTTSVTDIDAALSLRLDEAELRARRQNTQPWGYYWSTFGIPLEHFKNVAPLYPFGSRPLARRGRLQALVPPSVTARRKDAQFAKATGVRNASRVL
jgi:hypothetical protein